MKKRINWILTFVVVVFMTCEMNAQNKETEIARSLDTFTSVFKNLHTYYVDTISTQKSIDRAINAMLNDVPLY